MQTSMQSQPADVNHPHYNTVTCKRWNPLSCSKGSKIASTIFSKQIQDKVVWIVGSV